MHLLQSLKDLWKYLTNLVLRERFACTLQPFCQRLAIYEVHHIVSRAILLKQVMHFHNVLILQLAQAAGFLLELLSLLFKLLHIVSIAHADGTGCLIPLRHAFHEELLDGYRLFKLRVIANIRIAEASLPQHSFYSIFSTLQGGVRL